MAVAATDPHEPERLGGAGPLGGWTPRAAGYREWDPPAPLRGTLACLWMRVIGPEGAPPARVLPDACADIVWIAGRGAFVAGPDTGPVVNRLPAGTMVLGARFGPGAGGGVLGLPLAELRDRRVPLEAAWPAAAARLPADLPMAEAAREIADVAAELAVAGDPPDRAIRAAAGRLADPRARVTELAADLGLSDRQLRRRCHAAVGYGPKTLHRVLRFRGFLAAADRDGTGADLARLAAEAGYADQAHLTRDSARLAGLSPAVLLRERASS